MADGAQGRKEDMVMEHCGKGQGAHVRRLEQRRKEKSSLSFSNSERQILQ